MTDHSHQAGKNFAWLAVAQFATRLLGAGFYFFLSYRLLQGGLGQYSFISSFVPMWLIFADLGVSSYLYREWAKGTTGKSEANESFGVVLSFTAVLTMAIFSVFIVFNYFTNRETLLSLSLFFLAMCLSYYLHVNDLYLQSANMFRQPAFRQVVEKLTVVIAGGALLLWQAKVHWVFAAILLSQIVSYAYYRYSGSAFQVRFIWDRRRMLSLAKNGLPFMLLAVAASIYGKIDMVMLRYMKDFDAVGLYGAAYKFMDIAVLFSTLFLSAVFPVLSGLYQDRDNRPKFYDFFNNCFRISYSASLLIALFFIFVAPVLFRIFFPDSFGPSVLALRILIIAQVMTFISMLFNYTLIIQGRERHSLYIVLASAALNIGLNFVLIPKFSFYGAAWATVLAEVFNLYLLQHFSEWRMELKMAWKILAFLCANVAGLLLLRQNGYLNILWLGSLVLGVNAAALFVFGLLRKEDVKAFLMPFWAKFASFWQAV